MKQEYDFNQVVERRHSGSRKWDGNCEFFGTADVLPMWIADMDFKAPPAVMQAVLDCAANGVYGYPLYKEEFYLSIMAWLKKRHGWAVEREWILHSPGVMPAVSASILAFTKTNDKIIIQTPVYPAFFDCIKRNGRQIVENPLLVQDERYVIDFKNLEALLQAGAKMLLFCSPHNPVGRVWTKHELYELGKLCERYKVLILSDEIHSDLVFAGHKHMPLADISPELARRTITFIAPSKTFNIAGFYTAAVIIAEESLRSELQAVLAALEIDKVNMMGIAAATAAYQHGEPWLNELLLYLERNVLYMQQFIRKNIPSIQLTVQEGTYLMWLDFTAIGISHQELLDFLIKEAKVALSDGLVFGQAGFMRINFGCPHSVLNEGLTRIAEAVRRKYE
ncbi:MAG: PatB family C-S lyase [Pelosinus sp.]|nr:PatB family C-S lyase [Pelosinus sp.]